MDGSFLDEERMIHSDISVSLLCGIGSDDVFEEDSSPSTNNQSAFWKIVGYFWRPKSESVTSLEFGSSLVDF